MERRSFRHAGLNFSYIDRGGQGEIVLALHGHWMEAATFTGLADALFPAWRLIALDQRGHGHSDHAASYTREDYLGDIESWLDHLNLTEPTIFLGHSLGGINAIQFTARHPNRVKALIIEDIGAVVDTSADFILNWAGFFPTREALADRIGARLVPYLEPEFRQTEQGWTLAFSPDEIANSQRHLKGDYWEDWLVTTCPALLIRGAESRLTEPQVLEEMALRRPNTRLVTLQGGHVIHVDDASGFERAVRDFLTLVSDAGDQRG